MENILKALQLIDEKDIPNIKSKIENILDDYINPHQKCLNIIQERKLTNSDISITNSEISNFFQYCEDSGQLITDFLYLPCRDNEGARRLLKHINTDIYDEECQESVLRALSSECNQNNIDLYQNLFYIHDENGFVNFLDHKQATELIIRWLKNTDFELEKHFAIKLYEILTE